MTIYVDMDDVLADFSGAYAAAITKYPEQNYPQAQVDYFRTLKPIKNAIKGIRTLQRRGHDVSIATRPSVPNPLCYMEKRLWIEDHIDIEMCHKLFMVPDKGRLIGDLLIDDSPWPEFQGTQILFGGPQPVNPNKTIDWAYIIDNVK